MFLPESQKSLNEITIQKRKVANLRLKNLKKSLPFWVLLLPMLAYFLLFRYIPLIGNIIVFQDFNYKLGVFGSKLVGFKNFEFLFRSGELLPVLRNTMLYNITWEILGLLFAVSMAIFLSEIKSKLFKKITQSFLLLPYFVSYVILGVFVYNLFSYEYGTFNNILVSLGLQKINVYGEPKAWIFILTAARMWKTVGYSTIIYLAAITTFDKELYEAARADGAGMWRQVFSITIPLLVPTIIIMLLLNLGNMLSGQFDLFYQVTGDNANLSSTTEVLDIYVFRALIHNFDMSIASTAGLFQSVFGFVLVLISNSFVRKVSPDNVLF